MNNIDTVITELSHIGTNYLVKHKPARKDSMFSRGRWNMSSHHNQSQAQLLVDLKKEVDSSSYSDRDKIVKVMEVVEGIYNAISMPGSLVADIHKELCQGKDFQDYKNLCDQALNVGHVSAGEYLAQNGYPNSKFGQKMRMDEYRDCIARTKKQHNTASANRNT